MCMQAGCTNKIGKIAFVRQSPSGLTVPSKPPDEVSIGKFDVLATYQYARALLAGETDDEAKQHGIVAAIMGAKARRGEKRDHQSEREAAEKKSNSSITAAT